MRRICKIKFSTIKWNQNKLVSAWKIKRRKKKKKQNKTKQRSNKTNSNWRKKRKMKMCALSEGSELKTNRHFFQSGSPSIFKLRDCLLWWWHNKPRSIYQYSKGRFTRYDFVAYDKLMTGLRHELFLVNQTYNSLNGPKLCRRPVVS